MLFILGYLFIFMFCTFKNSTTTWLKLIWFTNFSLFFFFLINFTNKLVLSNFLIIGNFFNFIPLGFIDISCTYKIIPLILHVFC